MSQKSTCIKKIEGTLSKQTGVEEAKVRFNSSKAKVIYDETIITPDELSQTIEKLGYSVLSNETA